ncbi:MAG: HNH endonuclease [Acidimicrobiales bacterium]|jgi:hypothetical protein|nr:HNH endonuclease [Acidimicrobiales bacterium]
MAMVDVSSAAAPTVASGPPGPPAGVVEARAAQAVVERLLASFDPALVTVGAAAELVEVFASIENLGAAGKALAAKRVADGGTWRRQGYKNPAEWLARRSGAKVGDAVGVLRTADALHGLEATTQRFKAGLLSPRQARAVAGAASADPSAEGALLDAASRGTLDDLERTARLVRQAASTETDAARRRRLHRDRSVRTWIDDETGAGCGQWRLPPDAHARLVASLAGGADRAFRQARREGRVEPAAAYTADGLMALVDHDRGLGSAPGGPGGAPTGPAPTPRAPAPVGAAPVGAEPVGVADRAGTAAAATADPSGTANPAGAADRAGTAAAATANPAGFAPRGLAAPAGTAPAVPSHPPASPATSEAHASPAGPLGPGAPPDDGPDPPPGRRPTTRSGSWRDTKILVRVDESALRRGEVAPGERCEVAGVGPVPVAAVRAWIAEGAFTAAIVADGVDIRAVAHLGRRPLAQQITALQWIHGDRCAVQGCARTTNLEIDHVEPWARTRRTTLDELAPLCPHHHDLKTFQGFTLGPLDADGRRALSPPLVPPAPNPEAGAALDHPDECGPGCETDCDVEGTDPGLLRAAPSLFDDSS